MNRLKISDIQKAIIVTDLSCEKTVFVSCREVKSNMVIIIYYELGDYAEILIQ